MKSITGSQWNELCKKYIEQIEMEQSLQFIQNLVINENCLQIAVNLLNEQLDTQSLRILLQVVKANIENEWISDKQSSIDFKTTLCNFINSNLNLEYSTLELCNTILTYIAMIEWPESWDFLNFIFSYEPDEQFALKIRNSFSLLAIISELIYANLQDKEVRDIHNNFQLRALRQYTDKLNGTINWVFNLNYSEETAPLFNEMFRFFINSARLIDLDYHIQYMRVFLENIPQHSVPIFAHCVFTFFEIGLTPPELNIHYLLGFLQSLSLNTEIILKDEDFLAIFLDLIPSIFEQDPNYDISKCVMEQVPLIEFAIENIVNLMSYYSENLVDNKENQTNYIKCLDFFIRELLISVGLRNNSHTLLLSLHKYIIVIIESVSNAIYPPFTTLLNSELVYDKFDENSIHYKHKVLLEAIADVIVYSDDYIKQIIKKQAQEEQHEFADEGPRLVIMEIISKLYSDVQNGCENPSKAFHSFCFLSAYCIPRLLDLLKDTQDSLYAEVKKFYQEAFEYLFENVKVPNTENPQVLDMQIETLAFFAESRRLINVHMPNLILEIYKIYFEYYLDSGNNELIQIAMASLQEFLNFDFDDNSERNIIRVYLQGDETTEIPIIDYLYPHLERIVHIIPPNSFKSLITFYSKIPKMICHIAEGTNPNLMEKRIIISDQLVNIVFTYLHTALESLNPANPQTFVECCRVNELVPLLNLMSTKPLSESSFVKLVPMSNVGQSVISCITSMLITFDQYLKSQNLNLSAFDSMEANLCRMTLENLLKTYNFCIENSNVEYPAAIAGLIDAYSGAPTYLFTPTFFEIINETMKKYNKFYQELVEENRNKVIDFYLSQEYSDKCYEQLLLGLPYIVEYYALNLKQKELVRVVVADQVIRLCDYNEIVISKTAHKVLSQILKSIESQSAAFRDEVYMQPISEEPNALTFGQFTFLEVIRLITTGIFKFATDEYVAILCLKYFLYHNRKSLDNYANFIGNNLGINADAIGQLLSPFLYGMTSASADASRSVKQIFRSIAGISKFDQELQNKLRFTSIKEIIKHSNDLARQFAPNKSRY